MNVTIHAAHEFVRSIEHFARPQITLASPRLTMNVSFFVATGPVLHTISIPDWR